MVKTETLQNKKHLTKLNTMKLRYLNQNIKIPFKIVKFQQKKRNSDKKLQIYSLKTIKFGRRNSISLTKLLKKNQIIFTKQSIFTHAQSP